MRLISGLLLMQSEYLNFFKMKKLSCTLLIDDDEATNFINELLIQDMDFTEELLIAKNGMEALELIKQRGNHAGVSLPELILLDINMPVMDGFGFLEAFNELNIPNKDKAHIVMLTTSVNPKDVARIKEYGISTVINKPLTEQALAELVVM
jgi:CheY-like chemotaxis protein